MSTATTASSQQSPQRAAIERRPKYTAEEDILIAREVHAACAHVTPHKHINEL